MGTRERIKLEELSTDAGGGATANAALAAAVGKIKGSKSKAKEGDGEDGEDDGEDGEDDGDEDILVVNKAEAARLALDDGGCGFVCLVCVSWGFDALKIFFIV